MTIPSLFSIICKIIRKDFDNYKNYITDVIREQIYNDWYNENKPDESIMEYNFIIKDFILNKNKISILENDKKKYN